MIRRFIAFLFNRKLVYVEIGSSHYLRLVWYDGNSKPYVWCLGSIYRLVHPPRWSRKWHPVNFKSSEFEEKK